MTRRKKDMKITITAFLLSLLSASALADTEATVLKRIKAGDKIGISVQSYTQAEIFLPPQLQEKRLTGTYLVESETGEERVLKFANGNRDIYDKNQALIAVIRKGERKDLAKAAVRHWMPKGELTAGMKWSFEAMESSPASNAPEHICDFDGAYKASASDSMRELTINDKPVSIKVVVVDIDGHVNLRTCEGTATHLKERYVYSKDLDLVLEHEILRLDPFGKMLGGTANNLMKVNTVTTSATL